MFSQTCVKNSVHGGRYLPERGVSALGCAHLTGQRDRHPPPTATAAGNILLECILVIARKRSLRKLCFYRCLSVHGGGGACMVAGGACVVAAGGVCGCWGSCVVAGGHAWLPGAYMAKGACMVKGAVCGEGGCMAKGGVHGEGGHVW